MVLPPQPPELARAEITGYIARDEWHRGNAPGLLHVNPRDVKLFTRESDHWESVVTGVSGNFRRARFWRTGIPSPHGGEVAIPIIPDRRVPAGTVSFRHAGERE